MSNSKVSICNIALATLGAAAIRDFDEGNKRARMCDVMYDISRDLILSKFDWPFARAYKRLNEVEISGSIPPGETVYQLPNDCRVARDLAPLGSRERWRIMADKLYCNSAKGEVFLYYTKQETNTTLFSDAFVSLLALQIAIRIGPAITQDKKLAQLLNSEYVVLKQDVWESEANVGSEYRAADEDPNNDTFVTETAKMYTAPWDENGRY